MARSVASTYPIRILRAATRLGLVAAIGLSVTACGRIAPSPIQLVDLDNHSYSLGADQRLVISGTRTVDGVPRRIVCAEPSPDALRAYASGNALGANASLPQPGPGGATLTTALGVQASASQAEQAAYVGARNATIQLLRDGLFRACEAYMNGLLDDTGYTLILTNYSRISAALLVTEGLTRPQMAPPVIINSEAAASTSGKAEDGSTTTSAKGSAPTITVNATTGGINDAESIKALGAMLEPWVNPHGNGKGDIVVACLTLSARVARKAIPVDDGYRATAMLEGACNAVLHEAMPDYAPNFTQVSAGLAPAGPATAAGIATPEPAAGAASAAP